MKKVINFLGLHKSMVGLLGMVVLVGLGEKMAERFLPIYLLALGGGSIAIGLLNGLDNLLSALYSFPGGYIADKFGVKKALHIFNLMSIIGYLLVIFIPSWVAVIIGAVLFLSWTAISLPATMSLVSSVLPKNKRTMGVTMHSLFRRFPMALGPILGGVCISVWGETKGIRIAFVFALIMAVIAMILQEIMIREDSLKPKKAIKNPIRLIKDMTPALKNLLISDILIRFCEQIPYAFVVVWSMKIISSPVSGLQFGYLTAIEMLTAILIYIPVAYFADKAGKKPFVTMTFGFFTLFPLALLFSHNFAALVAAFILRGLKEFGEPTRKALIMDLAPENRKASMFGLYYLIRDIIVSVAAFGGAFLWMISPTVNFVTAFMFGVLGTIYFAIFGKDLSS